MIRLLNISNKLRKRWKRISNQSKKGLRRIEKQMKRLLKISNQQRKRFKRNERKIAEKKKIIKINDYFDKFTLILTIYFL